MEGGGQNFNPGTTNLSVGGGGPSHTLAYQHTEHICNSLKPQKRISVRFTLWFSQHPGKGLVFRNGKYQHLLFGWPMSPLPSWPPSLACILVGGVQISTAHHDAWKCAGNWVSPASPCIHTSKSLSKVRDRCATISSLPGWPTGGAPLQFVGLEHHTDSASTVCSSPLGSTLTQPRGWQCLFNAWGLLTHLGFPPILLDLLQDDLTHLSVLCHPSWRIERPEMMLTCWL